MLIQQFIVTILLILMTDISHQCFLQSRYTGEPTQQNETYDFIIVGASPAGSVIANRLTEISDWKVLLLEAGSEPSVLTDIPFICGPLAFTGYSWHDKTEPQDGFCRGCQGKQLQWPHGKAVGGGTVINYMMYVRGNPRDYDKWKAMGNPGWSYDDIFHYFLKFEHDNINGSEPGYHSTGGNLTVSYTPFRTCISEAFVKAAQEAGHKKVNYNSHDQIGVSFIQSTTNAGVRVSAEKAFLRSVSNRKNLKILVRARVVKILINPETKQAYGVQYVRNGKYYTVLATKEVILSAGGLNSPQLLMLSGVGPQEHLEQLGISVLQNLPVGQKLYDHAAFIGMTFQINDSVVLDLPRAIINPLTYIKWLYNGNSTLGSTGGIEALLFTKLNVTDDPDPLYPDIELILMGGGISTDYGLLYRHIFNIPKYIYDAVWRQFENKYIYQIAPMLVHPKSYGYLKLISTNPFHRPKFYANYLSDSNNHDVKTFIAALREIQRISQQPALQQYGATLVKTPIPGCEDHIFDSDDYWECALRTIITSIFHQMTTCKMGPSTDPEAVVDANLKVYGIKDLRVADAGVIPIPVTGHPMGPVYVIGEKVSDLIKEEWSQTT